MEKEMGIERRMYRYGNIKEREKQRRIKKDAWKRK